MPRKITKVKRKMSQDSKAISSPGFGEGYEPPMSRARRWLRFIRLYASTVSRLFSRGTTRRTIKWIALRRFGPAWRRLFPQRVVLLTCDSFLPSVPQPVRVSDTLAVSGWALSDPSVKRVKIYIDDAFLCFAGYRLVRMDVRQVFPQFRDSQRSGFRKLLILDGVKKGPHRLKIVAENDSYTPAIVEGLIEVEASHSLPLHFEETRHKLINARISVMILTKKPPADFEQTLERLRTQRGIPPPEIILINSGSSDLSRFIRYNPTVYNIRPEKFNHAATRNYAAEKATGDYLVFLTDDAIPAKDDLLLTMVSILRNQHSVAAVTARQFPRSDADLMHCQTIWGHYRMLGLDRDRIVGCSNIDGMTAEQKRAMCQIDDVCSCYRREDFLKYKYSKSVPYAEDLELGIRLVKRGFKIGQLFSTGVTHSHKRRPSYYLKRSYVDYKVLSRLLGYEYPESESWQKSLNDCLGFILHLCRSVEVTIHRLEDSAFCGHSIEQTFNMIYDNLSDASESQNVGTSIDSSLWETIERITQLANYHPTDQSRTKLNPFIARYLMSLGTFQDWLMQSHENLNDLDADFVETLYKLLAVVIGYILGQYYIYASKSKDDENTLAIDELLSGNV